MLLLLPFIVEGLDLRKGSNAVGDGLMGPCLMGWEAKFIVEGGLRRLQREFFISGI